MNSQFEHLDIEFERLNSIGTAEILLLKGEGGVISEEVKQALLECFRNVAWVNEHGQEYVDALRSALYPPVTLVSISAVYTQSGVVYPTDTLDDLKADLVVTATYSDGVEVIAPTYALSGELTVGDSVITVSYGGKTTQFTVEVTRVPDTYVITNTLTGCSNSNSATFITEGDSYSGTITANPNHTLVGAIVSITMGGNDITSTAYSNGTISIASVTGDLTITIVAVAIVLESISAVYTQSGTVHDTDSLDSLKEDLVVTATYTDSSTAVVTDYTLSGTLEVGTSTITVVYGGKTATFNVVVSSNWDYEWTPASGSLADADFTVTNAGNYFSYADDGVTITGVNSTSTCPIITLPVDKMHSSLILEYVINFVSLSSNSNAGWNVGLLYNDTKFVQFRAGANSSGKCQYNTGSWTTMSSPSLVTGTDYTIRVIYDASGQFVVTLDGDVILSVGNGSRTSTSVNRILCLSGKYTIKRISIGATT